MSAPHQSTPARKPAARASLEAIDGKGPLGGISRLTIARITSRLRAGEWERKIAASEGVTEACVKYIRSRELERQERVVACFRVGTRNLLEMVAEQEREFWDEEVA